MCTGAGRGMISLRAGPHCSLLVTVTHPPPCNILMTVRGIVTVQFVRLGSSRMAPAGARRRPLKRTPGPVDALPLVPCRTEPVLKIRAVGLTVVNVKWSCDYTDQGIAARQRALDRGYRGSRPPQPRDQSLLRNKRRYFQYAVVLRSTAEQPYIQHTTATSPWHPMLTTLKKWGRIRAGPALDQSYKGWNLPNSTTLHRPCLADAWYSLLNCTVVTVQYLVIKTIAPHRRTLTLCAPLTASPARGSTVPSTCPVTPLTHLSRFCSPLLPPLFSRYLDLPANPRYTLPIATATLFRIIATVAQDAVNDGVSYRLATLLVVRRQRTPNAR